MIIIPIFPEADCIEHDGVEYHYVWGWHYRRTPTDWSHSDWDAVCADHAQFGYSFDGYAYSYYYYDDVECGDSDDVVPCPGPLPPPLQGPSPRGGDWSTRSTAFVYDESAELALREQSVTRFRLPISQPGLAWCEFTS